LHPQCDFGSLHPFLSHANLERRLTTSLAAKLVFKFTLVHLSGVYGVVHFSSPKLGKMSSDFSLVFKFTLVHLSSP
jgi:hypothetical protein